MHHKKGTLESNVTKEVEKQNEEQRKLQVTGGSTFILSLPKDWAIRNELKRGSSMVVREEDDGSLSIAPSKFVKKEKQDEAFIKASLNDNPDAVMRTAISAYLDGFNILHIRAQGQQVLSSKLRNHLKNFARQYLVGTEIVIAAAAGQHRQGHDHAQRPGKRVPCPRSSWACSLLASVCLMPTTSVGMAPCNNRRLTAVEHFPLHCTWPAAGT